MATKKTIAEQIRTWSLNYPFIKQIHFMPSPEDVADLVFELNPVAGDDNDTITWWNEEHNIRESLELLLETKQIKLRLKNESMHPGIDKEVNDKGVSIL